MIDEVPINIFLFKYCGTCIYLLCIFCKVVGSVDRFVIIAQILSNPQQNFISVLCSPPTTMTTSYMIGLVHTYTPLVLVLVPTGQTLIDCIIECGVDVMFDSSSSSSSLLLPKPSPSNFCNTLNI